MSDQPLVAPDYWRQLDVFNPEAFNNEVHIIGVGATGSWVAYILAKMGVRLLHVWDPDTIEPHNLPNQIYGREDVDRPKVEALAQRLRRDCGTNVVAHQERVDGSQRLSGIIYLCVDDMTVRREIWKRALKLNLAVKLVVETRLGAEVGLIHVVKPTDLFDIRGFEATLYSSEEAEESPCTYRAIPTTVAIIAGMAAHKLVKFATNIDFSQVLQLREISEHSSSDMFCIRPLYATAYNWRSEL